MSETVLSLIARLRSSTIVTNIVWAAGGNGVFFVAAFFRSLLLAVLIGPGSFGIWVLGLTYLQYAQWGHCGILNAFRLDAARARGAGNTERLARLRRLTWTACLLPALAIAAGTIIVSRWMSGEGVGAALLVVGVLIVPAQMHSYANSILATEERFDVAARYQGGFAFASMALSAWWAWRWGLGGAVAAQVGGYLVVFLAYRRALHLHQRPLFDMSLAAEQFQTGLPVALNGLLYTGFVTLDRTVVASALGFAALGHYGLTTLARSTVGLIPAAVSEVVYMHTSTKFAATGSVAALVPLILRADRGLALFVAPLIGLIIIWVPLAVRQAMPAYQPGVTSLQLFLLGLFFTFPVHAGVLLTSIGRARDLTVMYAMAVVVEFGILGVAVQRWNIEGAALATAGASFFLFVVANVWGLSRVGVSARVITSHLAWCLWPLAACATGLLLGLAVAPTATGGHPSLEIERTACLLAVTASALAFAWKYSSIKAEVS